MAAFVASGVRDGVRPNEPPPPPPPLLLPARSEGPRNEPAAVTDQSRKEPQIKTGKFWGTDWSGDGVISLGFHMLIHVTAAK